MSATDVRDAPSRVQGGLDAIQRWDPCAGEVVEVAGPEESLAAAEDVLVMGPPGKPGAGPESLGDRVGGIHRSEGDFEGANHACRARLVGEWRGVLIGQGKSAFAVIGDVA